jgi:hypothetical protein
VAERDHLQEEVSGPRRSERLRRLLVEEQGREEGPSQSFRLECQSRLAFKNLPGPGLLQVEEVGKGRDGHAELAITRLG